MASPPCCSTRDGVPTPFQVTTASIRSTLALVSLVQSDLLAGRRQTRRTPCIVSIDAPAPRAALGSGPSMFSLAARKNGAMLQHAGRARDVSDISTESRQAAERDRAGRAICRKRRPHAVRSPAARRPLSGRSPQLTTAQRFRFPGTPRAAIPDFCTNEGIRRGAYTKERSQMQGDACL
jgi:hypothetical protein